VSMCRRFNFGKNFFYKGPSSHTSWTVQQLQVGTVSASYMTRP
jgi:hypothetical protein